MKMMFSALVMIGMMHFGAAAQSKFDQNFKVCRIDDKYATCDENTPSVVVTKKAKDKNQKTIDGLRRMDSYTYVAPKPAPVPIQLATSVKRNPRFLVSYDDPQAPYLGEESMVNDGVQKNKQRNLNYLDGSVQRPPSDGGNSDRK
jgi:hypothetical protein